MQGIIQGLKRSPDVVYVNGLFNARFSIPLQALSLIRRGHILCIAPRGELDAGALALKGHKKKAYIRAANATRLLDRAFWHASTEVEANNIRSQFPRAKNIIVRENDTELPWAAAEPKQSENTYLNAVFMSRVSPKKGLHVALHALASVKSRVNFDIIGPPEDARYVAECESIINALPENVTARFLGPKEPEALRESLTKYDLMLFPTAGENFGHAIAEGLSVACPIFCTDTTPWSAILRDGGGQVIASSEPQKWAKAIESYAQLGPEGWHEKRLQAASAYQAWRNAPVKPHFFDLLERSAEKV